MKLGINIVAFILLFIGGVWFFQGFNILRGSPMSGQPTWMYIGGILLVAGIILAVWNQRRVRR